MQAVGIIIGIIAGYFFHSIWNRNKNYGVIHYNVDNKKMILEFNKNPDDIPKYNSIIFYVEKTRNNIDSYNG